VEREVVNGWESSALRDRVNVLALTRMQQLAPAMLAATAELGPTSRASALLERSQLGKS
jgi:hypothetical protein